MVQTFEEIRKQRSAFQSSGTIPTFESIRANRKPQFPEFGGSMVDRLEPVIRGDAAVDDIIGVDPAMRRMIDLDPNPQEFRDQITGSLILGEKLGLRASTVFRDWDYLTKEIYGSAQKPETILDEIYQTLPIKNDTKRQKALMGVEQFRLEKAYEAGEQPTPEVLGFWGSAGKELSGIEGVQKALIMSAPLTGIGGPLAAAGIDMAQAQAINEAIDRVGKDYDYSKPVRVMMRGNPLIGPQFVEIPMTREEDELYISKYIEHELEVAKRRYTTGGEVAKILTQSIPFTVQMFSTAGLNKIGSTAARNVIKAALKKTPKAILDKLPNAAYNFGVDTAELVAGTATETMGFLPNILGAAAQSESRQAVGLEDKQAIGKTAKRAAVDTAIQVGTERLGGSLLAQIPVNAVSKLPVVSRLTALYKKAMSGQIGKSAKKAGWNGLLPEYLEEPTGTFFTSVTGNRPDDEDQPILERIKIGVQQDIQNFVPTILAISAQMVLTGGASVGYDYLQQQQIRNSFVRVGKEEMLMDATTANQFAKASMEVARTHGSDAEAVLALEKIVEDHVKTRYAQAVKEVIPDAAKPSTSRDESIQRIKEAGYDQKNAERIADAMAELQAQADADKRLPEPQIDESKLIKSGNTEYVPAKTRKVSVQAMIQDLEGRASVSRTGLYESQMIRAQIQDLQDSLANGVLYIEETLPAPDGYHIGIINGVKAWVKDKPLPSDQTPPTTAVEAKPTQQKRPQAAESDSLTEGPGSPTLPSSSAIGNRTPQAAVPSTRKEAVPEIIRNRLDSPQVKNEQNKEIAVSELVRGLEGDDKYIAIVEYARSRGLSNNTVKKILIKVGLDKKNPILKEFFIENRITNPQNEFHDKMIALREASWGRAESIAKDMGISSEYVLGFVEKLSFLDDSEIKKEIQANIDRETYEDNIKAEEYRKSGRELSEKQKQTDLELVSDEIDSIDKEHQGDPDYVAGWLHERAEERRAEIEEEERAEAEAEKEYRKSKAMANAIIRETDRIVSHLESTLPDDWEIEYRQGYGGVGSKYITLTAPDGELYKIRVSDHYAPEGAGFNERTQERHRPPDVNFVLKDAESTVDLGIVDRFIEDPVQYKYETERKELLRHLSMGGDDITQRERDIYKLPETSREAYDELQRLEQPQPKGAEKVTKPPSEAVPPPTAQQPAQPVKPAGVETKAQAVETPAPELPKRTSARQADIAEDRKAMGLDTMNSKEKQSFEKWLAQAIEDGIPERALEIAAEILADPRPLTPEETAGLVKRMAELKREFRKAMDTIKRTTDEAEKITLQSQIDATESEFDVITKAVDASGSEKGRALVSQKLTLNEDYELISILNRAKVNKGKELSKEERDTLARLTAKLDQLNAEVSDLQAQVKDLKARGLVKEGSIKRYGKMNEAARKSELDSLVQKTKELLKAGCY